MAARNIRLPKLKPARKAVGWTVGVLAGLAALRRNRTARSWPTAESAGIVPTRGNEDIHMPLGRQAPTVEEDAQLAAELAPNRFRVEEPAQGYCLRIPVSRVEELRNVAADAYVTPTTLMRVWILDRLDRLDQET